MTYGKIDRCVCFNVSFKDILEEHRSTNKPIDDIKISMPCCTKCKLCSPYIKKMYETGITEFNIKNYP